jgi:hypothetical protein
MIIIGPGSHSRDTRRSSEFEGGMNGLFKLINLGIFGRSTVKPTQLVLTQAFMGMEKREEVTK